MPPRPSPEVNLHAGVDLMQYFHTRWSQLHEQAHRNASDADRLSGRVGRIEADCAKLCEEASSVALQLDGLSEDIQCELTLLSQQLAQAEVCLWSLEEAITDLGRQATDWSYAQRKQDSAERVRQAASRKCDELAQYDCQLKCRRERRLAESARREETVLRERQLVFQMAFEEEVRLYREKGHSTGLATPAQNAPPDEPRLEDVSLDIAVDEVDALERFLEGDS